MRVAIVNSPVLQGVESHDFPDYPHSGIAYLAAYLRSRNASCDVIDSKLERLTIEQVALRIKEREYDIVGISAMTHDIVSAAKLAASIKSNRLSTRTVIGGVHATAIPEKTLEEFQCFDFLVHGEGEISFFELVKAVERNEDPQGILGVAYRAGNQVRFNGPRPRVENLDELPFPDYSMFAPCREYHIVTARGCPYHCIFCMSPYGREKARERSPKNVIEELKLIEKYHPRVIKFNDETFGMNRTRALRLLELICANGLNKTKKVASLRANHVDRELLVKMRDAGFYYIDYGVETGNPAMLKKIRKGITLEQAERAIRLTKEAGIKVGANYIIGHPGETLQTANETIRFAVKLNADFNAIGLMVPYPGTKVAEMAYRGEGGYKLISRDWRDYNKQLGNALELETLTRRQMERLQLKGYLEILVRNYRFLDLLGFCWQNKRAGVAFVRKLLRPVLNGKKPSE